MLSSIGSAFNSAQGDLLYSQLGLDSEYHYLRYDPMNLKDFTVLLVPVRDSDPSGHCKEFLCSPSGSGQIFFCFCFFLGGQFFLFEKIKVAIKVLNNRIVSNQLALSLWPYLDYYLNSSIVLCINPTLHTKSMDPHFIKVTAPISNWKSPSPTPRISGPGQFWPGISEYGHSASVEFNYVSQSNWRPRGTKLASFGLSILILHTCGVFKLRTRKFIVLRCQWSSPSFEQHMWPS
jgi:hypothetical protein